jgi:2-polyprenyl-6-methoxyphenol hydroxylase-like FAD-dependent oxidoreductase
MLLETAYELGAETRTNAEAVEVAEDCQSLCPASGEVLKADVTIGANGSHGICRAILQVSYLPPLVPTVLSVLTLGSNATDTTPYGYSGFVLDHLSAVQIIIKNGDVGGHPLYIATLLSLSHCTKAL